MSEPKLGYPALYESASRGAAHSQSWFFSLICAEYVLLCCVAIASTARSMYEFDHNFIMILLIILAGVFVYKIVQRQDRTWYQCRALAESVKTLTWRFCMRSKPFLDADSIDEPKANFRNQLKVILQANQFIAKNLTTKNLEQVTDEMMRVRKLVLDERVKYYRENRIDDQQLWYTKKSAANKRAFRLWICTTILLYIVAAFCLNGQKIGLPQFSYAFDPIIVMVTSTLGWLQIKRHGELAASYNLTAHEIGLIKIGWDGVKSEAEFSEFVNESELAFSREHTQWVARRDAA